MAQLQQKWQYKEVDGKHVINSEIVVHRFMLSMWSDSDDSTVTISLPLSQWLNSESGKWVMENAIEKPRWETFDDFPTMNKNVAVIARLSEPNQTYFRLRFL